MPVTKNKRDEELRHEINASSRYRTQNKYNQSGVLFLCPLYGIFDTKSSIAGPHASTVRFVVDCRQENCVQLHGTGSPRWSHSHKQLSICPHRYKNVYTVNPCFEHEYATCGTHFTSFAKALSISLDDACGDVLQNLTKYSCESFSCGRFA